MEAEKNPINRVMVIGAGLAGSAVAEALARRGWSVTVLEAEDRIASGASGNHAGIALPAITAKPTTLSRYSQAAFLYLLRHLDRLAGEKHDPNPTICFPTRGILQLGFNEAFRKRFHQAAEL
ncbi:MAG: FAD-dependent oxidoreductase, partial [Leptospiraceae bacterium]|nr:FAD-dependent oxidoreductase [Leptospiraceae bacterium]